MSVPPPDDAASPGPTHGSSSPPLLPPSLTPGTEPNPLPPPLPPRGPWGFWATLGFGALVVLSWVLVQVGLLAVWATLSAITGRAPLPKDAGANGLVLALGTCLTAPVSFGLSCLFARARGGMSWKEYLAFRPVSAKALALWTLILLGFLGLSDWLSLWLGQPIVPEFMHEAYNSAGFKPLLWLALVVGAPIMEEPLFRGFLFQGLAHSKLGIPGAMILSAALWASLHVQYDFYGMASIFVLGLVLGWARWKTGSLYTTLVLHAVTNLGATLETLWF